MAPRSKVNVASRCDAATYCRRRTGFIKFSCSPAQRQVHIKQLEAEKRSGKKRHDKKGNVITNDTLALGQISGEHWAKLTQKEKERWNNLAEGMAKKRTNADGTCKRYSRKAAASKKAAPKKKKAAPKKKKTAAKRRPRQMDDTIDSDDEGVAPVKKRKKSAPAKKKAAPKRRPRQMDDTIDSDDEGECGDDVVSSSSDDEE